MTKVERPRQGIDDVAYTVVKAALSALPGVGGPAAELFALLFAPPITRRRDDLVDSIATDLEELRQRIDGFRLEDLGQNEAFLMELRSKIESYRLTPHQVARTSQGTVLSSKIDPGAYEVAVAQLGSELKDGKPDLEIRLSGIYTLERIARNSSKDHWTIMEMLTAYVRRNVPWPPSSAPIAPTVDATPAGSVSSPPKLRVDIQAILTVLSRRTRSADWPELGTVDLASTNLQRAELHKAHLQGANLSRAHLEGANLSEAHLQGGGLSGVYLERADLSEARLQSANLSGAHLEGADLSGARLQSANLSGAHLENVHGLTHEQLQRTRDGGKGAHLPRLTVTSRGSASNVASTHDSRW